MKHRRVGDVGVAAVDSPRAGDPQRRLTGAHGADLNRRRMRPQHQRLAARILPGRREKERVLHLAGRVVGRKVERVEVERRLFDFRPLGDGEPELGHRVEDDPGRLFDRMKTARRRSPAGERDIGALRFEQQAPLAGREVGLAGIKDGVDRLAEFVELPAAFAAGIGVESAKRLEQRGELALLAGEAGARVSQIFDVGRGRRGRSRGVAQGGVVGEHRAGRQAAARATSTTRAKAAGSVTAMSASILRLTSTPAA